MEDEKDQSPTEGDVKSMVITVGHNVKIGLPDYSSEDVYEGVKVVLPIPGDVTPEKVNAMYAKFMPGLREQALKGVCERAEEVKTRNGVKSKINAASIVAGTK